MLGLIIRRVLNKNPQSQSESKETQVRIWVFDQIPSYGFAQGASATHTRVNVDPRSLCGQTVIAGWKTFQQAGALLQMQVRGVKVSTNKGNIRIARGDKILIPNEDVRSPYPFVAHDVVAKEVPAAA